MKNNKKREAALKNEAGGDEKRFFFFTWPKTDEAGTLTDFLSTFFTSKFQTGY